MLAPQQSVQDNRAAVTVGQIKNFAVQAKAQMDAIYGSVGGAGTTINLLVGGWYDANGVPKATDNQYAAATVGQLKTVAKPFYDRLTELGQLPADSYPWDQAAAFIENYALVSAGQVKRVFAFDIPALPALRLEALYYQQEVRPDGNAPFGIKVRALHGTIPQPGITVSMEVITGAGGMFEEAGQSLQSVVTQVTGSKGLVACGYRAPVEAGYYWVRASATGLDPVWILMIVGGGDGEFPTTPPGSTGVTFAKNTDGVGGTDAQELALGTDPADPDSEPPDADEDGVPDALDALPYDPNFSHQPSPGGQRFAVIDFGPGGAPILAADFGALGRIIGRTGELLWTNGGSYHFRSADGQEASFTLAQIKTALGGGSSISVTSIDDFGNGLVCGRLWNWDTEQWGYVYNPLTGAATALGGLGNDEHPMGWDRFALCADGNIRSRVDYQRDLAAGGKEYRTCISVHSPSGDLTKLWDVEQVEAAPEVNRDAPGPNDPVSIPMPDRVENWRSVETGGRVLHASSLAYVSYDYYNSVTDKWTRDWDTPAHAADIAYSLARADGSASPFMDFAVNPTGLDISYVSDHATPWVVANDPSETPDPEVGVVPNRIWTPGPTGGYVPLKIYGSKEQYEANNPIRQIAVVNSQGVAWAFGVMKDSVDALDQQWGVWANGEGWTIKGMVGAEAYENYYEESWEFYGISNQGMIAMQAQSVADNTYHVLLLAPFDVDVDSDNTASEEYPDRALGDRGGDEELKEEAQNEETPEEAEEDENPGVRAIANTLDLDKDHIPGYADGMDKFVGQDTPDTTWKFKRMLVEVPLPVAFPQAALKFHYSASDPNDLAAVDKGGYTDYVPPEGKELRLWTKDGPEVRDCRTVSNGGDFVDSEHEYTLQELGWEQGQETLRLYIEVVGFDLREPVSIEVQYYPLGVEDAVHMTKRKVKVSPCYIQLLNPGFDGSRNSPL